MMMISDLPGDLEEEILSRVPAKSLWELKTTCKRWYTLFRDPKFVEKNTKLSKAVRESILLSNDMVCSIAGDLHSSGFNTGIEFTGKLKSLKHSEDLKFSHIFHCDGLMLCSTERNNRLVVWNPCTGQRRNIEPKTCYGSNDTYALGYSRSSSSVHCYKILRWFYHQNEKKEWINGCEIYELYSDSWRVLDSFTRDYTFVFEGMSLKGDTYFVAQDNEAGAFLMKFDFTTERFVRLPLPIPSLYFHDAALLSVVRGEKLSLLHIDDRSGVMRIWVSNKFDEEAKDLSWRSDLVLEMDFDKFNLDIRSFLLDEENKAAICCVIDTEDEYKIGICIFGQDMVKQVYKDSVKVSHLHGPLVIITYVPSLIRIQKSTPKRGRKRRLISP
ncbi:hypothetical protein Bca52824_081554 [Brassica carinata]|uniref:F-box domain-containing protein n=1 Tax=Brassica carinata TaxID=52824 RepID=A0A8X7PIQ7_BRACI|nr:hypothetical protein Bca52824_081554 [Brassica carinata]